MAEEQLPVPLEIPWTLAGTTQRLKTSPPDDTTLAVFYYEPKLDSLAKAYPNERLLYFKFTLTISPCELFPGLAEWVPRAAMEGGMPVWYLWLDLRIRPNPMAPGGIRPYFHTAAPLRREMIETGVVGNSVFEGEASAVSIGKSASELHESVSSRVTTKSSQTGGSAAAIVPTPLPVAVGGSASTTSTSTVVDSTRNVDQYIESTLREASQERRELLSHMTNVTNVLSLLTAKHVGSPYLKFGLWPRPLHVLAVDPNDPNLWYNQLLHRRSSGLEGIQEFIAVALVPRDRPFCIDARMRRFCVFDAPPSPPNGHPPEPTDADLSAMVSFLYEQFPQGTPIDDLDVDFSGQAKDNISEHSLRPIVSWWLAVKNLMYFVFESPTGGQNYLSQGFTTPSVGYLAYKHIYEVFRDLRWTRYEERLATSPVERGIVFKSDTYLTTCYRFSEGELVVTNPYLLVGPAQALSKQFAYRPPGPKRELVGSLRNHRHYRKSVLRWNTLDQQFRQFLGRLPDDDAAGQNEAEAEERALSVLLDLWNNMDEADAANVPLRRVASRLSLRPSLERALRNAGVVDLRGVAALLLGEPEIEEYNGRLRAIRERISTHARCPSEFPELKPALSRASREALKRASSRAIRQTLTASQRRG